MRSAILRLLGTALGLWAATRLVPGVRLEGLSSFLLAALLLGVVNAVVRPILVLLTLPVTVLSLGLFMLVVNGAMLAIVAALMPSFRLAGLGSAILAAIVVSLTAWLAGRVGPGAGKR